MSFTVKHENTPVPLAVISTHGDIDASNFMDLVHTAEQAYQAGARNILLDLTDTPFLSSSGLVALHSIAMLLRGKPALDPASGWQAIHEMENNLADGVQEHIKLLNPQPRVVRTLERSGLTGFFAVFTDREAALASFQPNAAQAG
jgi:anti-anti-sigma regulatory factor